MITIIVAYDEEYGIGKDGKLPWHLPEDMQHFKETTMGHWVVMGRKTWESIPKRFRPLLNRYNVVVSRTNPRRKHRCAVGWGISLEAALEICEGEIFIIGGGSLYREAIKIADRIIASELRGKYDADVFFPKEWPGEWEEKLVKEYDQFKVVEYSRIKMDSDKGKADQE